MPRFSSFTPFGMWRFEGDLSPAKKIYDAMRAAQGGDDGPFRETGYQGAKLYAQSMGLGRVYEMIQRVKGQHRAKSVTYLLEEMEKQYGISPDSSRTDAERRARLSSRKKAVRALEANVRAGLTDILGEDFIDIITTDDASFADLVDNFSTTPPPEANFHLPSTSFWGTVLGDYGPPQTEFFYVGVHDRGLVNGDVNLASSIPVNSTIVFGSHNGGLIQKATVLGSYPYEFDVAAGTYKWVATLSAPLTKVIENGQGFTTSTFPYWPTGRLRFLIKIKPAASLRANTIADVNDFMMRSVRGVANWQITTSTTPGFVIGASPIGFEILGT
jgi:hypothetical protein